MANTIGVRMGTFAYRPPPILSKHYRTKHNCKHRLWVSNAVKTVEWDQ